MKKYSNNLIEESQKANNNISPLKISKGNNLDFDVLKINQDLSPLCNNYKNCTAESSEVKKIMFM